MNKIILNCDMGEGFGVWKMGTDELIMPHISMANLACGFHASDPQTIDKSVQLAKKYDVQIGAHPGYQDLYGFGRRSIEHSDEEIQNLLIYQLGALNGFCIKHHTFISYVKPHGALYNDMMREERIFRAVLEGVKTFNKYLKVMILSSSKNEEYEKIADSYEMDLIFEAFADRNYTDEGTLVPRKEKNAVIHDIDLVKERIKDLQERGFIGSEKGKELYLKVDTLCVHGDNEKALEYILELKEILD